MRSHRPRTEPHRRAILLAVRPGGVPDEEVQRSLDELGQLLEGLGIPVETSFVQRRSEPVRATYVGEGKLREIAERTGGPGVVPKPTEPDPPLREDLVVVVDDELGPGQRRNLQRALGVEVLDRVEVILRVFESRARTREAKLEIELARLEYELPRVRDDHSLGDREGGGGRASRGHSNVELAKQRIRNRMAQIRRELERIRETRDRSRIARSGHFRAALVGYTNAGKSSLMRLLTGKEIYVRDMLFATLGTTVRQLAPPTQPPVLLTDTVGFIDRLPHQLVASFRSTLAEAKEASLLLHVVDVSHPSFRAHIRTTNEVLAEIGADAIPAVLVLNQADKLDDAERAEVQQEFPEALLVSALDPRDGKRLHELLCSRMAAALEEAVFTVPYAQRRLLAEFEDRIGIVHEDYGAAITVRVRGTPESLEMLRSRLAAAGYTAAP